MDAFDLDGLARYVTRRTLATEAVWRREAGRVEVLTPSDPATGSASVTLDVLDFVAAALTHLLDGGKHWERCYGADARPAREAVALRASASNRASSGGRGCLRRQQKHGDGQRGAGPSAGAGSSAIRARFASRSAGRPAESLLPRAAARINSRPCGVCTASSAIQA